MSIRTFHFVKAGYSNKDSDFAKSLIPSDAQVSEKARNSSLLSFLKMPPSISGTSYSGNESSFGVQPRII